MEPIENIAVLKFGGAAFETIDSYQKIAGLISARLRSNGGKLIVVVSAMRYATDQLIGMAKAVSPKADLREKDMLISVGERISASLLSIALIDQGIQAKSFTGSQAGIITDESHENAKILRMQPRRIESAFTNGVQVAVVAGFQGVSQGGEITTLGRGGSDVTAVALAACFSSQWVEFYKDVSGVYDKDPKIHMDAVHFPRLGFDQAITIAEAGAKVLHPRAIQLAKKNFIPLLVQNFSCNTGCTWIVTEDEMTKKISDEFTYSRVKERKSALYEA